MKHLWKTLAVLVVVAAAVGYGTFRLGSKPEVHAAVAKKDALAWLRTDFRLNDAQFAAIRKLHESYSVVCERHCEAIQEAAMRRNALKAEVTPDPVRVAEAERRFEELREICETAIAAHVREVATQMPPEQGQRYLALVLPKIADFDHLAAPDLGLNAHRH